ncbi:hypothetical protein E2C01_015730 [Portunus trituberculatus]|uniref:Uncharacterized protein n=1 Tax=Portunus trituberculatus TaxID=210409 RepID=A0A5B7DNS6_PORTR|nr:hypothetical protein [Portunus trituberculatus]
MERVVGEPEFHVDAKELEALLSVFVDCTIREMILTFPGQPLGHHTGSGEYTSIHTRLDTKGGCNYP